MVATDVWRACAQIGKRIAALLGGVMAASAADAATLPEDHAEAMVHYYDGGGVTASGPAFLVRKSLADRVSLSGSYYVDMVSNASIDVVTTASPYRERRVAYNLGVDYAYRDSQVKLGLSNSREPDYTADATSLDVSQEVFGGMTTVSLGFTRGRDWVGKHGTPTFSDIATHWQYRFGLTQVLTPQWLASANLEAISDDGYLGSPYRVARVFGAAVPESVPRTRSSRALSLHTSGDLGSHDAVHAEYRYFWDTWAIRAHTLEGGYSRYVGDSLLVDGFVRYYRQSHALFYSDNAMVDSTYVTRNRQLGTFDDVGLGGKLTYSIPHAAGHSDVKVTGAYEYKHFHYSDFTDIRTGKLYSFDASLVQLFVSANF